MERLLVVDDDTVYRERLVRAFISRGHEVGEAWDLESAREAAQRLRPQAAVVDLRLPSCDGLEILQLLRAGDASVRVLILTGYGSIANALEAVRLGAWDYLNKPADAEDILAALETDPSARPRVGPERQPPSLERVEWEHIQRVIADHDGNISRAARALGIHRRTLQRKLQKFPPHR